MTFRRLQLDGKSQLTRLSCSKKTDRSSRTLKIGSESQPEGVCFFFIPYFRFDSKFSTF